MNKASNTLNAGQDVAPRPPAADFFGAPCTPRATQSAMVLRMTTQPAPQAGRASNPLKEASVRLWGASSVHGAQAAIPRAALTPVSTPRTSFRTVTIQTAALSPRCTTPRQTMQTPRPSPILASRVIRGASAGAAPFQKAEMTTTSSRPLQVPRLRLSSIVAADAPLATRSTAASTGSPNTPSIEPCKDEHLEEGQPEGDACDTPREESEEEEDETPSPSSPIAPSVWSEKMVSACSTGVSECADWSPGCASASEDDMGEKETPHTQNGLDQNKGDTPTKMGDKDGGHECDEWEGDCPVVQRSRVWRTTASTMFPSRSHLDLMSGLSRTSSESSLSSLASTEASPAKERSSADSPRDRAGLGGTLVHSMSWPCLFEATPRQWESAPNTYRSITPQKMRPEKGVTLEKGLVRLNEEIEVLQSRRGSVCPSEPVSPRATPAPSRRGSVVAAPEPMEAPDPQALAVFEEAHRLSQRLEDLIAEALQAGCDRDVPGAMDVFEQASASMDVVAEVLNVSRSGSRHGSLVGSRQQQLVAAAAAAAAAADAPTPRSSRGGNECGCLQGLRSLRR